MDTVRFELTTVIRSQTSHSAKRPCMETSSYYDISPAADSENRDFATYTPYGDPENKEMLNNTLKDPRNFLHYSHRYVQF